MFWRKPTTVNVAIAPLLKTLKNLEVVAARLGEKMVENTTTIDRLTQQNDVHLQEASRARVILQKLNEIVGE